MHGKAELACGSRVPLVVLFALDNDNPDGGRYAVTCKAAE
jgi:hypothetical protein